MMGTVSGSFCKQKHVLYSWATLKLLGIFSSPPFKNVTHASFSAYRPTTTYIFADTGQGGPIWGHNQESPAPGRHELQSPKWQDLASSTDLKFQESSETSADVALASQAQTLWRFES